jgi:2-oxoglutarate ferredoxin oxidoreductase subunit alpha
MTPFMLLTDGYLANAAEPWRVPSVDDYKPFPVTFRTDPEGFHPFVRDDKTKARAWAVPGTPGLEHRIGGIEKDYDSGNISYDAANHQKMTDIRRDKVLGIADDIPLQDVALGEETGDVAVLAWGSTYGAVHQAVNNMRKKGEKVSHIHLRYIWPLPPNLGALLKGFKRVIIPEMNDGQLVTLIRAQYLVDAVPVNKVSGQPFKVAELESAIIAELEKSR